MPPAEPTPSADDFPAGQTGDMRDLLLSPQTEAKPAASPAGPWQPPSAEELQMLLPQYEITALLGRGGMGAVYKGRQIALDRPVAIKILSNTLEEADASFAERFKNEARALGKLSHPGIVGVYDFGEAANGLLYIVMEFIDGTDVAKMLSQQKRLHTEHAMAITAHVCDALAYAHERGIIHRDIKPANIMVGYDGVVKVADFGLAKMTHNQNSGLTQSGMAMGTLHYMAPEALMLGSAVDHRADIYAVGVMFYQMLTGKLPQGLFEMPSLQVPGLDPRYDGIIGKAMREDRELRYPSVLDMRHDLDAILTQPVVKVEPSAEKAPAALETQARPQRPGGQPYRPPQPEVLVRTEKKGSPLLWAMVVALAALAAWLHFKQEAGSVTPPPSTALLPPSENQTLENAGATLATPGVAKDEKPSPVSPPVTAPLSTTSPRVAQPVPSFDEPEFIPLLDASHTVGWQEIGDGDSTTLSDGVLTFRPRRNWAGYYWYTSKTFSDFTLRLQYQILTPGGNSGVSLRVKQPSRQIPDKVCYEVDVSNSPDPLQATGAIMFVKPPVARAQKNGEWNDLEITASGQNYRVTLNGVLVNDFIGDRSTQGHIGLQIGVSSVQYRHIRIKELTPAPEVPPLPSSPSPTTWTDTKGRSITATFKALASGNVLLDIAGKVTPVPLNTLSAESQKLAHDLQPTPQASATKSNVTTVESSLLGLWYQRNDGLDVPFHPLAFFADGSAGFGWLGKGMGIDGRWQMAGDELRVSWPNGCTYHIELKSGTPTKLTGKGTGTSTFSMEITHTGIRPANSLPRADELADLSFDFSFKAPDRTGSNGVLRLLKDGTVVQQSPMNITGWKMANGFLMLMNSRNECLTLLNQFERKSGKWHIRGQYVPDSAVEHRLEQQ